MKNAWSAWTGPLAATVLALALSACGSSGGGGAAGETTDAKSPEALVKANCISCHGNQLEGRGREKLNLLKVGARMSKEEIADKITNGGGGMVAFKGRLTEEEISSIADFLAEKK
ncbi:c-type cytochrome [Paenibacillus sp. y28]|uniref:c-type cytochrome n=1 Tax=Paenibacillus sp. y28 TaxID=3129110 RepID=UPI00301918F4